MFRVVCCWALLVAAALVHRPAAGLPLAENGQEEITTVLSTEPNIESTTFVTTDAQTTITMTGSPAETINIVSTESTTEAMVQTTTTELAKPSAETVEASATTPEMVESTTVDSPVTEITLNNTTPIDVVRDKLSEQIRKVLRHYQTPNPLGFPGAPIPDPMKIPPMKKNFGLADMTFFNMTVYGLSKFKVEHVKTDLKNMQVYVLLKIQRMYVLGNYTLRSWFGAPVAGPFNVTLIDVDAEAAAELVADDDGLLQANDTEIDMRFRDCELDFKNLGFMATMFQGIISTVGSVMFDGIKPFIINEMNTNLKSDINSQIKAITSRLPRIKMPLPDLAILEGRKYVKRMGYDPYRLSGQHIREGPLNFTVTELTVAGLSEFQRVGDVGLQVHGPVLQMSVHVITGVVTGAVQWQYQLGLAKTFSRVGHSNFSVDHIQVQAVVNQTLDIRNKPIVDRLEIEVGKVAVIMDRREPLDFVIETAVNSLPTLLRHIIVDILEEPIKMKVQSILDDVQLEEMVEERLPELDRLIEGNNSTTALL